MESPLNKGPDPISSGKMAEPASQSITPGQAPEGFESYMRGEGQPKTGLGAPAAGGQSPMDAARGPAAAIGTPSVGSLAAQAKNMQDALGTVGQQLRTKNLTLKRSHSHLVKQKLTDANNYIRSAASKLGANSSAPKMPPGLAGIARFIAMIDDGQNQLQQVQQQLKQMSAQGGQINAGEMLSVQVKMGLAQQEIEYTSTLLGKVVQSITTIINTQL